MDTERQNRADKAQKVQTVLWKRKTLKSAKIYFIAVGKGAAVLL